jgi:hypothetical protein
VKEYDYEFVGKNQEVEDFSYLKSTVEKDKKVMKKAKTIWV